DADLIVLGRYWHAHNRRCWRLYSGRRTLIGVHVFVGQFRRRHQRPECSSDPPTRNADIERARARDGDADLSNVSEVESIHDASILQRRYGDSEHRPLRLNLRIQVNGSEWEIFIVQIRD